MQVKFLPYKYFRDFFNSPTVPYFTIKYYIDRLRLSRIKYGVPRITSMVSPELQNY